MLSHSCATQHGGDTRSGCVLDLLQKLAPTQATLMSWAGRIAANSFYCYSDGGGRAAPACRSWPHPQQHLTQQQAQESLTQQRGADSCAQPPASSQHSAAEGSAAMQRAATTAGGHQPDGASAAASAARAAQAQQQAAAGFDAQQQLRRLQLAQRRLWQGAADVDADASAPLANSGADSSGNTLPVARVPTAGAALDKPHTPQPQAPASSEAVSGQSSDQQQQQQQEQQQQQQEEVRQSATGDGSSAATPSSAVAESASGTRLQPVGRELFITASYLNHSCASAP